MGMKVLIIPDTDNTRNKLLKVIGYDCKVVMEVLREIDKEHREGA